MIKNLLLILIVGFWLTGTAFAETLTIVWASVKVLQEPKAGAKPIDLVFGNDKYSVLKRNTHWYQVQTFKKRVGWVPASAVNTGMEGRAFLNPATKGLISGTTLQRLGFRDEATDKLFEVIRFYPNTLEFYEAVRHMLYYSNAGKLNPSDGVNPPDGGVEKAKKLLPKLVLDEGNRRLEMGNFEGAIPYFEERLKYRRNDHHSMKGIHKALVKMMEQELAQKNYTKLGLAVGIHQKYFPTEPLPKMVGDALHGKTPTPLVDPSKLPSPRRNQAGFAQ